MDPIAELGEIARVWPQELKKHRKAGKKVVGHNGRFIPAELIYAAGAIPYLLCRGGEAEPAETVLPYMLRIMNPYARAQIGYHILGVDPVVPMLDLIVAECSDCHMARLADLFEYFELPTAKLGVPTDWQKKISFDYYYDGLLRIKATLEKLSGCEITDKTLQTAIEASNEIRRGLQKIARLRREHPPRIGGLDFIRLNHYSFCCDPSGFLETLPRIHDYIEQKASPFDKKAPRILLAGRVVSMGDYILPKLVEDSGGVLVAELLDEGLRDWECEIGVGEEPLQELAEHYFLKRTPPSVFQPSWEQRLEAVKALIADFGVDGVIWYQLSFDEVYNIEYTIVSNAMAELEIPILKVESSFEYSREAMGPLTTRVESFIELLKEKGK